MAENLEGICHRPHNILIPRVHSEMKPGFSDLHVMLNSIRVILTHIAMSTKITYQKALSKSSCGFQGAYLFTEQKLSTIFQAAEALTTCLANISLLNGVFLGETKMARRVTENCLNLRRIFFNIGCRFIFQRIRSLFLRNSIHSSEQHVQNKEKIT